MKKLNLLFKGLSRLAAVGIISSSVLVFQPTAQASIKLNTPFGTAGTVRKAEFALTASEKRVVYLAQTNGGVKAELFSTPCAGEKSLIINDTLASGEVISDFKVSPDGSQVVFSRERLWGAVRELFSVPAGGNAKPTQLNFIKAAWGHVKQFEITPDGKEVIYISDEILKGKDELFSVPIDGSKPSKQLNPLALNNQDVISFKISPDNAHIAFVANYKMLAYDLFSYDRAKNTSVALTAFLNLAINISDFEITPDSKQVVYLANDINIFQKGLSVVPIAGGASTIISAGVMAGDIKEGFQVTPDSSQVVFRGEKQPGFIELFATPLNGAASPQQLNGTLPVGSTVSDFQISSDGQQVVYRADQANPGQFELYSRNLDAASVPVQLNFTLPVKANVEPTFTISQNGKYVVYVADAEVLGRKNLYRVPIWGGVNKLISLPILSSGDITALRLSPMQAAGDQLIYIANQESLAEYELYAVGLGAQSDLDGDNKNDVLLNRGKRLYAFSRNASNQFFPKPINTPLARKQKVCAVGDLTDDQRPELILKRGQAWSCMTLESNLELMPTKFTLPTLANGYRFVASGYQSGESILVATRGSKKVNLYFGTNVISYTNASAYKVIGFGNFKSVPSLILKQKRKLYAQMIQDNSNGLTLGNPTQVGTLPRAFKARGVGMFTPTNINNNVDVIATQGRTIHFLNLPLTNDNLTGTETHTLSFPAKVVGPR